MLSVPQLDDLSFDQIFERSRSRIPLYTEEWTDFNHHDPGITTLQAFAWLTDMLNFYTNASGEIHRLKYLKLLGIVPECAAAACNIALSVRDGEILLPRGTRLSAGDAVFEVSETYSGSQNAIVSLQTEAGGVMTDLTPFAGVDGDYARLFSYDRGKDCALYIGFENKLPDGVRFYAEIYEHPGRNAFDKGFVLSRLEWEFWDGEAWRAATLLEDDTCGFLRGGFINLSWHGESALLTGHDALPTAHYLRARLVENEYDLLPQLGKIWLNCAPVIQVATRAQALVIPFDGRAEIPIDYYVRETDVVCVAVGGEEGYSLWFERERDDKSLCEVTKGEYEWQRVIHFDMEAFGAFPGDGQELLVTITDGEIYEKLLLGYTGGYANQRMAVDVDDLFDVRLALAEKRDGRPFYRLWEPCEDIKRASWEDPVFTYDRDNGHIMFGDGISGIQPEAGQLVVVVTAKSSLLDRGNIRAGRLDSFVDDMGSMTVFNPEDAVGGKRPQPSRELERKIEDMIRSVPRAVNEEDYRSIVRETPGLLIDGVNVISGREYARYYHVQPHPNTVYLAVKPYSERESRPVLSEIYRQKILENMERYRLLTTKIEVLPARYVGVEVYGRIVLRENTSPMREQVRSLLEELIDFSHTKAFGANVVYGRIFSHIEMLPWVSRVSQLSLGYVGECGEKSEQGDILVYPDAMAYISTIDIEFVS